MEKLLSLVLSGLVLTACCTTKGNIGKAVKPLASGIDINNLSDTTVAADLSDSCFNWNDGKLTFSVYAETLYDSVEISTMKSGDTLFYEGKPMVVKSVKDENVYKSINGGLEEGGAWLQPTKQKGIYRASQFDDHSIYTKLGTVVLPLSPDFTIVNCKDEPNEPSDSITTGQRQYIDGLRKNGKLDGFFNLNTRITVKGGKVTKITRIWIP